MEREEILNKLIKYVKSNNADKIDATIVKTGIDTELIKVNYYSGKDNTYPKKIDKLLLSEYPKVQITNEHLPFYLQLTELFLYLNVIDSDIFHIKIKYQALGDSKTTAYQKGINLNVLYTPLHLIVEPDINYLLVKANITRLHKITELDNISIVFPVFIKYISDNLVIKDDMDYYKLLETYTTNIINKDLATDFFYKFIEEDLHDATTAYS